jgi:hypothetical protein
VRGGAPFIRPLVTPTYASPIKGEEGGGREISVKLIHMGANV